jgi:hypothetical protein
MIMDGSFTIRSPGGLIRTTDSWNAPERVAIHKIRLAASRPVPGPMRYLRSNIWNQQPHFLRVNQSGSHLTNASGVLFICFQAGSQGFQVVDDIFDLFFFQMLK